MVNALFLQYINYHSLLLTFLVLSQLGFCYSEAQTTKGKSVMYCIFVYLLYSCKTLHTEIEK